MEDALKTRIADAIGDLHMPGAFAIFACLVLIGIVGKIAKAK
jgi:hypothetical protein